jgi:hypothetical protein
MAEPIRDRRGRPSGSTENGRHTAATHKRSEAKAVVRPFPPSAVFGSHGLP